VAYFLVPFALSFVAFLAVYRLVPNRRVRLSHLWVGALLAAVGFEAAKLGCGLYITNFGRYPEVYGTLAGAVLLLFFVFVVATVVIYAAEVTALLGEDHAGAAEHVVVSEQRAPAAESCSSSGRHSSGSVPA
jgi:membrane protein